MIRNAVGTVISRMIVTAITNRTIGMLFASRSTMSGPSRMITANSAMVSASRTGTTVKMIFPGSVSRDQLFPMTVIGDEPPCARREAVVTCPRRP